MYLRNKCPRKVARPGKIIILFAVSLVGLVGILAIALEGGLMLDHKRQVQGAADAAALAAAESLFSNFQTYKGADNGSQAVDAGKACAERNGFPDNGTTSTVTVNVPPLSGKFVGLNGYAEVIIEYNQPRYFSKIFGSTEETTIRARAVARGMWAASKVGILVLDLHEPESLKSNGNGTVQVANADLIVNSDDPSAVGSDGTGSLIKVTNAVAQLTGGLKANTTIVGPVVYNQPPTPDPLAYLTPPPKPTTAIRPRKLNANNQEARTYIQALLAKDPSLQTTLNSVNQVFIMEPALYDQALHFQNTDLVIFKEASFNNKKGVYYLYHAGLTSNGATMVMDPTGATTGGMMFYVDPGGTSDGINITGGHVVLRPPTMPPFKGILIWYRRDADVPLQITGQGSMEVFGTFYVAGGTIKITGSDTTGLDVIGSQYISRLLQSGGNGSYTVNWDPDVVAPLRQLAIVE
jgi:hypothetical protein